MLKFFIILFVFFLASAAFAVAAIAFWAPVSSEGNLWITAYATYARTPLFSAFITLGSFLLTLKTAILQRLKDAYDSETYKTLYLRLKVSCPDAKYYGSLERLGTALATNIVFSFLTAVLQLTIGFIKSAITVGLCVGIAATTISLIFYLSIQMFLAHREWFSKIEAEKQEDLKKGTQ